MLRFDMKARWLPGVDSRGRHPARMGKEGLAMRRFALLLGIALSTVTASAVAQNCDGFVDLLASSPFCPDVTWMKTTGVTMGCDATHYWPNENVSRLQMASFMRRLGYDAFLHGGN